LLALGAVMVLSSLGLGAGVRGIGASLGLFGPSPVERAFVLDPTSLNHGLSPHATLHVVVVMGTRNDLAWRASWRTAHGEAQVGGVVRGAPNAHVYLAVTPTHAVPAQWLDVSVAGVASPLQVRIR
jgi:hypothetical protein